MTAGFDFTQFSSLLSATDTPQNSQTCDNARPLDQFAPNSLHLATPRRRLGTSPADATRTTLGDPIGAALRKIHAPPSAAGSVDRVLEEVRTDFASAPSSGEADAASDRRTYPRRWARGAVSVAAIPEGLLFTRESADLLMCTAGVAGELLDLSRNGLAFIRMQPLQADARILVRLSHQKDTETFDTVAEVVRATELGDGLWKIMARFEKPLSFDDAYELCEHEFGTHQS